MEDLSGAFLELLSENPDIQEFMDRLSLLLGNPVMMIDAHYRILYYSRSGEITIPLWVNAIKEHYVSDGIIGSMQKSEIVQNLQTRTDCFSLPLPEGYEALRVPLFYRGEWCGFLGMYDYLRPFAEGDGKNLELAGKALSVLYNADPNILGRLDDSRDDLLLELLKCDSKELAQIVSRRNGSMGFGREKILVCLTKRVEGMSAENVALGRLKDFLQTGIYFHASAIYNNHLMLLFSLEKISDSNRKAVLLALQESCLRYDLHAGISFPFQEDSYIPLAYKQSLKAALFGDKRDGTRDRIAYYEDFLLKDIINAALRIHSPSFYEHPVITKLQDYDREFGTKYLDTLRTYLDSFCNMKATALELGVHYNTIKYRISMIEEITGQDLKADKELLLRLVYSLRIFDFAREYDRI